MNIEVIASIAFGALCLLIGMLIMGWVTYRAVVDRCDDVLTNLDTRIGEHIAERKLTPGSDDIARLQEHAAAWQAEAERLRHERDDAQYAAHAAEQELEVLRAHPLVAPLPPLVDDAPPFYDHIAGHHRLDLDDPGGFTEAWNARELREQLAAEDAAAAGVAPVETPEQSEAIVAANLERMGITLSPRSKRIGGVA